MPIYEYACQACGIEKEHLQKMSDSPIANCPACGSSDYIKKVSAAAFQLKGTGWYVTDFKNKNAPKPDSKPTAEPSKDTASTTTTDTTAASSTTTTTTPAASTTGQ